MKIAYLDCFAGISGDMFLGALLGAGVPLKVLEDAARAMNLGVTLKVETVDRSGISSLKVHVLEGSQPAEGPAPDTFAHQQAPISHTHAPKTQHQHKTGHPHTHDHSHDEPHAHDHPHGRSLTVIRTLIQSSTLSPAVKTLATHTFELLGESEAKIHNVPVDDIHFHEVGAVDAIIDIVCASAGIVHLDLGAWHASPVNVGGGMVVCAHGTFPVPAPATADLLRHIPTYSAHLQKELVTPTGAAILRALAPSFGPQPPMSVTNIGYGAGTRNPENFPNVLRLSLGESSPDLKPSTNTIAIVETNIDDATPQLLAHVASLALAQGALDVTLTPVLMKKGRPGTVVTILCEPQNQQHFQHLLLRELPTLGVRTRTETRTILDRTHRTVETPYGPIRVKSGSLNGTVLNETPEYEDCRTAAATHNVPLKTVQQAALAASQATSTK